MPDRTIVQHDRVEDIDWDLIDRLCSDNTLIGLPEITAMCGLRNRQPPTRWRRAMENYTLRGCVEWPPSPTVQRGAAVDNTHNTGVFVTELPPHPAVLPPPAIPSANGQSPRWYRGVIYEWGMRTRRISLTGESLVGSERSIFQAKRRSGFRTTTKEEIP